MSHKIYENETEKHLRSEFYNWSFNKKTGLFARWGKTVADDPQVGLPEILDFEVSEVCSGVNGAPCAFCYKSNTGQGRNTSIELYKQVMNKMPKSLTQVALGIGDIDGNPDLKQIIEHTRELGLVPNITINGDRLTDEWADFFASKLGAIAVSVYDKEISYNAIKKLTDRGMTQVNIHCMICEERFDFIKEIMNDTLNDSRLEKLNAMVLLSLKKRGRARLAFTPLSQERFSELVNYALEKKIRLGFDSCGACKFMKTIEAHPEKRSMELSVEPCESSLFSAYINVDGKFFPCSFAEGEGDWQEGIDVLSCEKFISDIWHHPKTEKFRQELLNNKRSCPLFDI